MPERVTKYPDPVNGPKINQFAIEFPGQPYQNVEYCTQDGTWNGPEKMRRAEFATEGPWPEATLLETNHDESDNTFGIIGPFVCVLTNGESYVQVNPHSMRRYSGKDGLVEAPRRRHGSTDMTPGIIAPGTKVEEYTKRDLGLTTMNTAFNHALKKNGERTVARLRAELSVVRNQEKLPQPKDGLIWMDEAEFMLLTLDGPNQAIIARAQNRRILPLATEDQVYRAEVKMQAFIENQCGEKK